MDFLLISDAPLVNTSPEKLHVSTQQASAFLPCIQPKSFSRIHVDTASPAIFTKELMSGLYASLKEGGVLTVHSMAQLPSDFLRSLAVMNGFEKPQIGAYTVETTKPVWATPAALLKNGKPKNGAPVKNPWLEKVAGRGVNVAGTIDEEALLGGEGVKRFANESDCMTKAKPCDNCTCGRAELDAGRVTKEQLENGRVESSCGKCYLGDAYRCAGCPYLGQPAFEPGDKLTLKNTSQVELPATEREEVALKPGSKVMLEI